MIYITQGHEKSIGLEVFFKSFILLTSSEQKKITLIADKQSIADNLNLLGFKFTFSKSKLTYCNTILNVILSNRGNTPASTRSLEDALNYIGSNDILLTLPTSKDQLILNGEKCKGYTEYLRKYYKQKDLCMLFKAFNNNTLLITDHIPLCDVSKTINTDLIIKKVKTTVEYFKSYFTPVEEVLISGINPHCGEGGLLGQEDSCIPEAIQELNKIVKTVGPISADTLHFHKNRTKNQLNVYMYHDQGLPVFKDKFKTIGLNITLGLPFLRMSVDHGTAFDLYGKGVSDYSGCYYMLKEALKIGRSYGRK